MESFHVLQNTMSNSERTRVTHINEDRPRIKSIITVIYADVSGGVVIGSAIKFLFLR